MKRILLVILLSMTAMVSQAELRGKNVVFVHGFQIAALNPFLSTEDRLRGAREQAGDSLNTIIDEYIYYDSARRLTLNSATLASQIKQLEQKGTCADGCYFVTASTGDLVARYVISRLGQWGIDPSKFSILMSFDIVGAGGGTEIADRIVNISQGGVIGAIMKRAISNAFFGIVLKRGGILGILHDLRPSVARNTATGSYDVPRIRVAAGKETPIISQLFIKGGDDGLVPLHSACGSARQEAVQSCIAALRIDGRIKKTKSPSTLKYNHFPFMMAPNMSHTNTEYKGRLVPATGQITLIDGDNDSEKYTLSSRQIKKKNWLRGKRTFVVVNKPDNQLAIDYIINELK